MSIVLRTAPVLLVGMSLIAWDFSTTLDRSTQQLHQRLLRDEYAVVRDKLERLFTLAYQTNRTLSLLPSVRSLQGGNRSSAEDDPVAQGRFTKEGAQTVQQLYNNLAANVAVSEIYCVVKDFRPQQGEVPFFMYDELIVEAGPSQGGNEHANPDAPEDFEDDEYQYLQGQLKSFGAKNQLFRFKSLDEIPAQASPIMRTCDNSQYRSKLKGDVRNAEGFIYSVPFYSFDGTFKGVISSIFRINILEALLLQVPFLPIDEAEQRLMRSQGWEMPANPGNFVLYVRERNFWVADRRDQQFLDSVQTAVHAQQLPDGWHQESLKVVDEHPWMLLYRFDPISVREMHQGVWLRAALEAAFLGVVLLGSLFYQRVERTRIKTLEGLIEAVSALKSGDLTRHHSQRVESVALSTPEGKLERVFAALVSDLHAKIVSLDRQSQQTEQISTQLTTTAQGLAHDAKNVLSLSTRAAAQSSVASQRSHSISTDIDALSLELASITSGATELTAVAKDISSQCQRASHENASGEARASRARSDMLELEEAVRRSREEVGSIQALAHQTNMVALNATIEAAAAGKAGQGFAVVAREVKALSRQTQEAAEKIDGLMSRIRERAGLAREASESVTAALQSNLTFVHHVTSAMEEQSATISEVSRSLENLHRTTSSVASSARAASSELESAASDLRQLADASQSLSAKEQALGESAGTLDSVVQGLTTVIRHFKIQ